MTLLTPCCRAALAAARHRAARAPLGPTAAVPLPPPGPELPPGVPSDGGVPRAALRRPSASAGGLRNGQWGGVGCWVPTVSGLSHARLGCRRVCLFAAVFECVNV